MHFQWLCSYSGAVRKNRLTATATDKEIGTIIGNWFRGAKDREGGRKDRLKKKLSNAAADQNEQENPDDQ